MTKHHLRKVLENDDIFLTGLAHNNAVRNRTRIEGEDRKEIIDAIVDEVADMADDFETLPEKTAVYIAYWIFWSRLAATYGIMFK